MGAVVILEQDECGLPAVVAGCEVQRRGLIPIPPLAGTAQVGAPNLLLAHVAPLHFSMSFAAASGRVWVITHEHRVPSLPSSLHRPDSTFSGEK